MADTKPVPLLNFQIDTKPRQVIAIDGKTYELRRPDDLTIDASVALSAHMRTYAELQVALRGKPAVSRKAKTQLGETMKALCALMVAAPPAILQKLTPIMRFRVINVFLTLSLTNRAKAAKAMELSGQLSDQAIAAVLAGKTGSPSSAASTAATPSRGSRATRSGSSSSTKRNSTSSPLGRA